MRLSWLILYFISSELIAEQNIVLWQRNAERPQVFAFVELAAEKTLDDYGPYHISVSPELEQGRAFEELANGTLLNVAVAGSDIRREKQNLTIYTPIHRGLLGFKICLTRENARDYLGINTVEEFNQIQHFVGAGTHWPDRLIYEANGLRVVHSPIYAQLFGMLTKKRFDCFLRSLNEIDKELLDHGKEGIVAEQNLAFVYPYAMFIYVSNKHPKLKQRLDIGLKRAMKDGSYEALFQRFFADTMKIHGFYHRKVILLKNPFASPEARKAINTMGIINIE